ncbi:MAG: SUMF1/EgtB/PvdO family nonheme iron enzyme, partial [Myxococcota bacterium]|nr:SUMF1/EgtB/PvdO family nonheme iron enzyme [Myxococcota bacterium]
VTCTATVADGYGESDTSTATATVQNTAPTMGAVSITPGSPGINNTLMCSASGSDLNDGSLSPSNVWTNDTTGATLGTSATLSLDSSTSSPDDIITCTVTFTDSNGASVSDSSSVTIQNSTPAFDTEASISPNTSVYTSTDLTCTAAASDLDDGSLTVSYSWTVGASTVSTSSTYTVSATDTDVGDTITCTASASDANGESISSTASVTVENTLPSISGTAIAGGTYNTDTPTCSATVSDPDETLSASYTWSILSVTVGTGSSLDLATTAAMPLDDVLCTASVSDSDGGSASGTDTLTLDNRAPSTPSVSISPSSPVVGQDDLVCTIDTASSDADGQTVNYTYTWTVAGASTSYSTDTIPASDVGASETWVCTVTPDDGIDSGTSASASVLTPFACSLVTDCDENLDVGNGYSLDFINVAAGSFSMGSPSGELNHQSNETQHNVTLSNDVLVSATEVTQGVFNQLMGYQSHANKSVSNGTYGGFGIGDDYPAFWVSWNMAAAAANAMTDYHNNARGTSLQQCYSCSGSGSSVTCSTDVTPIYSCDGYRLLTEAEWEYAARAGSTSAFWTPSGGGNIPASHFLSAGGCNLNWTLSDGTTFADLGWFCGNTNYYNPSQSSGSREVATKSANDFGLFDMTGNVYEWTHDTYTASLGSGSVTDPVEDSSSSTRVYRDGAWTEFASVLRVARRAGAAATSRDYRYGFRIGRSN